MCLKVGAVMTSFDIILSKILWITDKVFYRLTEDWCVTRYDYVMRLWDAPCSCEWL